MQIVIDIPEHYYENNIKKEFPIYLSEDNIVAILPTDHGRLIDADEILKSMDTWDKFGYTETGCFVREPSNDYVPYVHYEDMVKAVSNTQTIVEADKTEVE